MNKELEVKKGIVEKRTRETDLAWLAGFIDGEGSIGISKEWNYGRPTLKCNYRPSLSITNSNRESLERAQEIVGNGAIITHKKRNRENPRYKPSYHYTLRNPRLLVDILLELTPFLVIKKIQAILVADFCDSRNGNPGRGRYKSYMTTELETHRLLSVLNKRGAII